VKDTPFFREKKRAVTSDKKEVELEQRRKISKKTCAQDVGGELTTHRGRPEFKSRGGGFDKGISV